MNTYPDYDIVQKCLLQIEEKLKWGSSDQWHSDVFLELSEKIHESTQVLLSPTTLKRIWGKVSYKNAPSINTLNTLSQFAGHTNWRDFKSKAEIQNKTPAPRISLPNFGIIMTSAAFMTLLFISIYSMVGTSATQSDITNVENIEFSSKPVTDGLPNSVIFDLDLKGIESDSIYIQQFWDVTKTIKLDKDQKQATGIYYFPGYFRAKLLVDGNIMKEHDLFIKSNGWLGTIDYEPVPKYIGASDILNDQLGFSPSILDEIKVNENPIVSSFHLINGFDHLSADNFTLNTSFRNVYNDKWAVCQSTKIVVLGKKGAMIIPFSIPGCVSDIGLLLNDVFLSGKRNDLSAFGFDQSNFNDVEIKVDNKNVRISFDGRSIYDGRYFEPVGELIGIRFRFLGAGEVKSLTLSDENGDMVRDMYFGSVQ